MGEREAAGQKAEWIEADGAGGFASGTVSGLRSRRYHALVLTAAPPGGRYVLLNGFEIWLSTPRGRFALSAERYTPDVIYPDGFRRIERFSHEPWPSWTFRCEDGSLVSLELCVSPETRETALRFELREGADAATLELRPLISGRDFHDLHHENPRFRFGPEQRSDTLLFRPYEGLPPLALRSNASYRHDPTWYRNFRYDEERDRGLDFIEDLASPGVFRFEMGGAPAVMTLAAFDDRAPSPAPELFAREAARRTALGTPLDRAAEAYVAARGRGPTLIAGYPWFSDWGRDTFIALRGLCLARGRLDVARDILLAWADQLSEGMLPNRFPDGAAEPEYNSVDASLWYVVAVHDYLTAAGDGAGDARPSSRLREVVQGILRGYSRGTRFGIRQGADGLLAAGVPGVQLTWMDAKVGEHVVTPRIGKPVEVQALWLNALRIGAGIAPEWAGRFEAGLGSFRERFWNERKGCLFDVVDADHATGQDDDSVRPNQILAVGGLPFALLDGERARRVVEKAERHLLTPLGLRTLAPEDPRYRGRYEGGVRERDGAYHQGTVWPWLLGPFVEAWLRVNGSGARERRSARRFVQPLLEHLEAAGLGHVSEIADGDAPHTPRGAPFQAWSLGELLRILRLLSEP